MLPFWEKLRLDNFVLRSTDVFFSFSETIGNSFSQVSQNLSIKIDIKFETILQQGNIVKTKEKVLL